MHDSTTSNAYALLKETILRAPVIQKLIKVGKFSVEKDLKPEDMQNCKLPYVINLRNDKLVKLIEEGKISVAAAISVSPDIIQFTLTKIIPEINRPLKHSDLLFLKLAYKHKMTIAQIKDALELPSEFIEYALSKEEAVEFIEKNPALLNHMPIFIVAFEMPSQKPFVVLSEFLKLSEPARQLLLKSFLSLNDYNFLSMNRENILWFFDHTNLHHWNQISEEELPFPVLLLLPITIIKSILSTDKNSSSKINIKKLYALAAGDLKFLHKACSLVELNIAYLEKISSLSNENIDFVLNGQSPDDVEILLQLSPQIFNKFGKCCLPTHFRSLGKHSDLILCNLNLKELHDFYEVYGSEVFFIFLERLCWAIEERTIDINKIAPLALKRPDIFITNWDKICEKELPLRLLLMLSPERLELILNFDLKIKEVYEKFALYGSDVILAASCNLANKNIDYFKDISFISGENIKFISTYASVPSTAEILLELCFKLSPEDFDKYKSILVKLKDIKESCDYFGPNLLIVLERLHCLITDKEIILKIKYLDSKTIYFMTTDLIFPYITGQENWIKIDEFITKNNISLTRLYLIFGQPSMKRLLEHGGIQIGSDFLKCSLADLLKKACDYSSRIFTDSDEALKNLHNLANENILLPLLFYSNDELLIINNLINIAGIKEAFFNETISYQTFDIIPMLKKLIQDIVKTSPIYYKDIIKALPDSFFTKEEKDEMREIFDSRAGLVPYVPFTLFGKSSNNNTLTTPPPLTYPEANTSSISISIVGKPF